MRGLIIFLLGVVAGGYAMHVYDRRGDHAWHRRPESAEAWRNRADNLGDDISEKLRLWHLTGDDIRDDLSHTGEIVRQNAAVAGARIDDARIGAVIKAKLLLDHDLSARDIRVEVDGVDVILTGTAPTTDLVGKAMGLALDTDGVRQVVSHLRVEVR